MTEELTKVCHKCGRELPVSEFYKDKTRKDGLRPYCKECRKEYRENNLSYMSKYLKGYYKCVVNPSCPRVGGYGAVFEIFTCEVCGKEFRRRKAQVDWDYEHRGILPKYCSKECRIESTRKSHKSKYANEIERIKKEVG